MLVATPAVWAVCGASLLACATAGSTAMTGGYVEEVCGVELAVAGKLLAAWSCLSALAADALALSQMSRTSSVR